MEIVRWASLVGSDHMTCWVVAAALGFAMVIFVVALCIKSAAGRRRENNGLEEEVTHGVPRRWRRWTAVRERLLKVVQRGGFKRKFSKDDDGEVLFLVEPRASAESKDGVWQRKIMMGERCELPSFSGLILYDEHGNALPERHDGVHAEQKSDFC